MSFYILNTLFLVFFPLILLPIVLHLFFRVKKKREIFPSFLFFQIMDVRYPAKRRLKEVLLLLCRILTIAFIIGGFCGFIFFKKGKGAENKLFIIDNSASMDLPADRSCITGESNYSERQRTEISSAEELTCLDVAKSAVETMIMRMNLSGGGKGDETLEHTKESKYFTREYLTETFNRKQACGIILLAEDFLVCNRGVLTSERGKLLNILTQVNPTNGNGSVKNALSRARKIASSDYHSCEIHIFTDLHSTEWNKKSISYDGIGPISCPIYVHYIPHKCGRTFKNVVIKSISFSQVRKIRFRKFGINVVICNTSKTACRISLDYKFGDGESGTKSVNIAANSTVNFHISHKPESVGPNWVSFNIKGDDFAPDNYAYKVFMVEDIQRVLFFGDKKKFGLLPIAMSPDKIGRVSGIKPVFVKKEASLSKAFASLKKYIITIHPVLVVLTWRDFGKLLMLNNATSPSDLTEFVFSGGNLLILPEVESASRLDNAKFLKNRQFIFQIQKITGIRPEKVTEYKKEKKIVCTKFGIENFFQSFGSSNFKSAENYIRIFKLMPISPNSKHSSQMFINKKNSFLNKNRKMQECEPKVLLKTDNGQYVITVTRIGKGHIFCSGIAYDTKWSNMPLNPIGITLPVNIALYKIYRNKSFINILAGERPSVFSGYASPYIITGKESVKEPVTLNSKPVFAFSGIYEVSDSKQRHFYIGVSAAPQLSFETCELPVLRRNSKLARYGGEKIIIPALEGNKYVFIPYLLDKPDKNSSLDYGVKKSLRGTISLLPWMLLVALGLLTAEMLLSLD